jgi:splicing factor 3A subunit 1
MSYLKLFTCTFQIDWHSFVVVETVDYQPWEVGNFPPPTNPTEVGARVLIQRRAETTIPVKLKSTDKVSISHNFFLRH